MSSIASSTRTRSSQLDLTPFFPKADGHADLLSPRQLPLRPRRAGPVFDSVLSSQPLTDFDQQTHDTCYAVRSHGVEADLPPERPDGFTDDYLMPSLTRNERLRLTMLWYYTRDVLEDEGFLRRLQDKLDLVHTLIDWEFALIGLLSEDVYTRLATAGLPLAILPRRESTCSHTVNQAPGVSFPLARLLPMRPVALS